MNASQSRSVSAHTPKATSHQQDRIDYAEVFDGVCRSPLECITLSVALGEKPSEDETYCLLNQAADVLDICQAHLLDNDNERTGGGIACEALAGALGLVAGVVRIHNQISEARARHETRALFSNLRAQAKGER